MSKKSAVLVLGALLGVITSPLSAANAYVPTLALEVTRAESAVLIDRFLSEHTGDVVHLAISVCGVVDSNTCPSIEHSPNKLTFDAMEYDANYDPICEYSDDLGEGITFYFSDSDAEQMWGWDKFATCKDGSEFGLNTMSGYFRVPESSGYGQGWTEWLLSPVAESDIN